MHILPGLLTVLLAAPCGAAAPQARASLDPFAGVWKGTVTTAPGSCVWEVSGQIMKKAAGAEGHFSYSGTCDETRRTAVFSAVPRSRGCYTASVPMAAMPSLRLTACIGPAGTLTFDSELLKGSLKLSEENTRAELTTTYKDGDASGTLQRIAGGEKKKPADAEKPGKPEKADVLIGGY